MLEPEQLDHVHGALVPGLPHLLRGDLNPRWAEIARAVSQIGDQFAQSGVRRIVYFSTKWLSVLGQMYQGRGALRGIHVDEMWYDLCDLPFDFRVDTRFAHSLAEQAKLQGHQTQIVDYEGFPVDTGTIVADRLLNQGRFAVNMVACSLYLDFEAMQRFAATVRKAIASDDMKTAIVVVSGLSGHWHRKFIAPQNDEAILEADDVWNRRILGLMEKGAFANIATLLPAYAQASHVDMGGKAFAFLMGAGVAVEGKPAQVKAYGGIYGTGASVVAFA